MSEITTFAASIKLNYSENISIYPPAVVIDMKGVQILGFSFAPFHGEVFDKRRFIDSLESLLHLILEASDSPENFDLVMSYFIEITEDEYYKID